MTGRPRLSKREVRHARTQARRAQRAARYALHVACPFCDAPVDQSCDPERLAPDELVHAIRAKRAREAQGAARAAAATSQVRRPTTEQRARSREERKLEVIAGPRGHLNTRTSGKTPGPRKVTVRYVCPVCAGPHPRGLCPEVAVE